MLNKKRFQEQINLMSTHFLRRVPPELMREYWRRFKEKEQIPWDKAVEGILEQEERFPVIAVLQGYYQTNLPEKENLQWPSDRDLEKQVKTKRHKYYLELINGLRDDTINIEDRRVQRCLKEQGEEMTFLSYDFKRKIFRKSWRPRLSDVAIEDFRKRFGVRPEPKFTVGEFKEKWGKSDA